MLKVYLKPTIIDLIHASFGIIFVVLVLFLPVRFESGWNECWRPASSILNDCGIDTIWVRGNCPLGWTLNGPVEQGYTILGWEIGPAICL